MSTCAHDGKYLHAKGCQMDVEKVDQLSQTKEARRLPILTILTLHNNKPGDDHPRRVADGRSSKKSKSTASHHVHRADGIGLGVVLLGPGLHPHRGGLGFPEHGLAIHQRYSEINECRQCDQLTITHHYPKIMSQSCNPLLYHGLGLGTWKKWFSKAFKVLNKE